MAQISLVLVKQPGPGLSNRLDIKVWDGNDMGGAPELPPVCSEKSGCEKDTWMPLATTSIWSISIKVYMVSISQNLSFSGVENIQ